MHAKMRNRLFTSGSLAILTMVDMSVLCSAYPTVFAFDGGGR